MIRNIWYRELRICHRIRILYVFTIPFLRVINYGVDPAKGLILVPGPRHNAPSGRLFGSRLQWKHMENIFIAPNLSMHFLFFFFILNMWFTIALEAFPFYIFSLFTKGSVNCSCTTKMYRPSPPSVLPLSRGRFQPLVLLRVSKSFLLFFYSRLRPPHPFFRTRLTISTKSETR